MSKLGAAIGRLAIPERAYEVDRYLDYKVADVSMRFKTLSTASNEQD